MQQTLWDQLSQLERCARGAKRALEANNNDDFVQHIAVIREVADNVTRHGTTTRHLLIIGSNWARTACGRHVSCFYPNSMMALADDALLAVTFDKQMAECEVCKESEDDKAKQV